jgi:hypothetical protein
MLMLPSHVIAVVGCLPAAKLLADRQITAIAANTKRFIIITT